MGMHRRTGIPVWLRRSGGWRPLATGILTAGLVIALGGDARAQDAVRGRGAADPDLARELEESFHKLERTPSHRMTIIVPALPEDEMEMTLEPMVMETSGGLVRSVMRAQTEEGAFAMESVVAPDRYASRMEFPGMEEMRAEMAGARAGSAGPGGIPGLSNVLSGGLPGLSNVMSGGLPGLSGVMDSPIVSGAVSLLTGGFNPMNLLSVGMSMAGGMMSPDAMVGGLIGGNFGDWQCEKLDLSDQEAGGEEAAGAEGWLRSAVRLGEVEIDGVSTSGYRLQVEHEGEPAEITVYTMGPGGLPRRLEMVTPELDGKVTIDYAYDDIPEVEFPDCK